MEIPGSTQAGVRLSVQDGRVFYLVKGDRGFLKLRILGLADGKLIGSLDQSVTNQLLCPNAMKQDPISIYNGNTILLADNEGTLLGLDCSNLSEADPTPSVKFRLKAEVSTSMLRVAGPLGVEESNSVAVDTNRAMWTAGRHLLVADLLKEEIILYISWKTILRSIPLPDGQPPTRDYYPHVLTRFTFKGDRAFGIFKVTVPATSTNQSGCVAVSTNPKVPKNLNTNKK